MSGGFAYLDHNATTPVCPAARRAVAEALALCGNASSVHRAGRAARQRLAEARAAIGRAIGLPAGGRLVFTSGGTEANHLALRGLAGRHILRSAIEHDSVRAAAPGAEPVPVEPGGTIDLGALEARLAAAPGPCLVSVMAANNETGVIQPVAAVAALAHARGALVHCDAVQAVGKIPFDIGALGLDLVTLSAHKLGGPPGVAALALSADLAVEPLLTGGGQEGGLRAGTENLPGILGFAAALAWAVEGLEDYAGLAGMRDRLERRLLAAEPRAVVFGNERPRLANTLSVALPGVDSEVQVMALDLAGVGVSAGAACSSGKVRRSHVLEAMGAPPALARAAIRVSLGRDTTEQNLDRLVEAWAALARRTAGKRQAA